MRMVCSYSTETALVQVRQHARKLKKRWQQSSSGDTDNEEDSLMYTCNIKCPDDGG